MKKLAPIITTLLVSAAPVFAGLTEPDIVFYGRVVHLGGGEEYLMTSGELEWTVTPPATGNGPAPAPFKASATLVAMNNGTMSYHLRVPTDLVVPGTLAGVLPGITIPAEPGALPFKNTAVTFNGMPLRMADPAGLGFDPSSVTRGDFRRLDFIFDGSLPDADGDGLPDWWEDKYGTDKHKPDANGDPDGDGVFNLAEFTAGTDPTGSDQHPRLPAEILVSLPPGGRAIPVIRVTDADSSPDQLRFTVDSLPAGVGFSIIGQTGTTNSFSQADIQAGRVVLALPPADPANASALTSLSIPLTLRDETPSHPAASTTLQLSIAAAATLWEGWGLPAAAMPATLPAIQDATRLGGAVTLRTPSGPSALDSTFVATVSGDISRLFLGTPAADTLLGSAKGDLIAARAGDTVRAGAGADRILFAGASGLVTVTDFSLTEKDIIDLRGLVQPTAGRRLPAYIQLSGSDLRIDANGDGSGYTDLTIRLTGATLPADLADLWDNGALETGEITPETTIFLATSGQAGEENLASATFTLRRRGDATAALSVPVTWSGTATMGVDYSSLPSVASFAAGQKSITFTLQPLADDIRETTETVQLTVGQNSAWVIASGSSTATLTLLDLPSRVWIEVAERIAYKDSLSPAQIIIRRSGPLAASLTAQLTVTGRATPAVDYRRLPASVTFAATQESIALDIVPLASASLSRTAEEVVIAVKTDPSYLFGITPVNRVIIVERPRTLASWMTERQIAGDPADFLNTDVDRDGVIGLAEFAFGRNPAVADRPHVAVGRLSDGRLSIEFHRWPGAPEIAYDLERSSTLKQWAAVPETDREEISSEILTDGRERVKIAVKSSQPAEFLRIAVRNNIE